MCALERDSMGNGLGMGGDYPEDKWPVIRIHVLGPTLSGSPASVAPKLVFSSQEDQLISTDLID